MGNIFVKTIEIAAIYYVLSKRITSPISSTSLVKVAFDTRRIDQETEYNPRRGLQYYHRSEEFIKPNTEAIVNTFLKLKTSVDELKSKYIGSPEWLDSNCRILSASLDRILRSEQKDTEFFEPQLNYLQELMDVRYRLQLNDIETIESNQLKEIILSKDEPLKHSILFKTTAPNQSTPQLQSNGVEQFIKELLNVVRATTDNKNVERSITFTIRDTIIDKDIKVSG